AATNLRRQTGPFANASLPQLTGAASFRRVLGSAPHHAAPLPPATLYDRQIRPRGFQRPPFATVARIPEKLPMPWRGRPVCTRIESRAYKPTMRARRGLVNATDAGSVNRSSGLPLFLQGFSST